MSKTPAVFLRKETFSIYGRWVFSGPPTLSEAVKICGMGSNRDIRQRGFRVESLDHTPRLLKKWEIIKDPYYIIEEESYLATTKGKTLYVVSHTVALRDFDHLGYPGNAKTIEPYKYL